MARRAHLGGTLVTAALLCLAPRLEAVTIEQADRAWSRRAEGFDGEHAQAGAVLRAIAAYEDVLAGRPDSLQAIWKLQRALHFLAEYTPVDEKQRRELLQRGRDLGVRAMEILHGRDVKGLSPVALAEEVDTPGVGAAVHFWAGIFWGMWGEREGALAAVRKGVAKRIRDHAATAIELDPGFADGGPYRLLGRLHSDAPRVPLFTGWVSRDEAVRLLEEAVKMAPEDFANRLYLAQALLEHRPERRSEALDMLRRLVTEQPRSESLVEDTAALKEAGATLEKQ